MMGAEAKRFYDEEALARKEPWVQKLVRYWLDTTPPSLWAPMRLHVLDVIERAPDRKPPKTRSKP